MDRGQPQHPLPTDLALGLKTATVVVVLALIVAIADQALVTPTEATVSTPAEPAKAAAAAPQRIEVPFTVNVGDVEAPPSTF